VWGTTGPLSTALYRAGVRTFSRSFKFHRPRGVYCGTGDCPNCGMVVDGEGDRDVAHAQLTLGSGMIMLGSESTSADRWGPHAGQSWVYVAVEDPDALHERAKAAGAEVVMEPMDTDYGSRDFAIRDPEGNLWNFGTYRP
jgi:uncharacterized glyoxalase superfamily protein PhnB